MQCVMLTQKFSVINKICQILLCCVHFFICFPIVFMVSNFLARPHSTKMMSSLIFLQDIYYFYEILKLIFNKRNSCLYFITNFLSNPKIFSKDIHIFKYFLRMIDFGNVGEFLKKIELYFSDGLLWYKQQIIYLLVLTSLFFVDISNINPFW